MPPSRLPPQPSCSALEQTYRFLRAPLPLVEQCVHERGDLFSLRLLGLGTWVFACAPDVIEQVVRAPPDVLVAGELNRRSLGALIGPDTSFTLDGEAHRARRRLLNPLFTEGQVVRHTALVCRVADEAVESWPVGRPFPLLERTFELAFEVMLATIFGTRGRGAARRLGELVYRVATEGVASPLLLAPRLQVDLGPRSPWGRIKRLLAETLDALTGEIERRLASGEYRDQTDTLSRLLVAHVEDPRAMPVRAVADEVLNLLIAGHETSGSVMAWAVERALSHPAVDARVHAELADVVGDDVIDPAHLPRLTYLDAVIHETSRTRPLLPFAGIRLVKKPFALRDHVIPPGVNVALGLYGLGLQESLFPDPHAFRPERFIERKFTPFEWNPFGGGPRLCVGRALAILELKVALATVFRRLRLRLVDAPVGVVRRGIFLAPARGLRVVSERRSEASKPGPR